MTGDCLRHNAADAILAKRGPFWKSRRSRGPAAACGSWFFRFAWGV